VAALQYRASKKYANLNKNISNYTILNLSIGIRFFSRKIKAANNNYMYNMYYRLVLNILCVTSFTVCDPQICNIGHKEYLMSAFPSRVSFPQNPTPRHLSEGNSRRNVSDPHRIFNTKHVILSCFFYMQISLKHSRLLSGFSAT